MTRARLLLVPIAVVALASAACTDFASPAELTKPTVLAVIADPPLVAPGATTTLTVAMAGPEGVVIPDDVQWRLAETLPGVPPLGEVTGDDAGASYTAPAELPELPEGSLPLDSVEATITVGGETVIVIKAILITELAAANPAITSFTIGEADAVDGLTIARDAPVALAITTDPAPGEDATFAWYSTVGLIDQYQSNPTELIGAEAARQGWLFVVMRDGRGGVAWRGVSLEVE